MRRWGPRLTIVALFALVPALAFVLRDPAPQRTWSVVLRNASRPVDAGRVVAVVRGDREILGLHVRTGARRWAWRAGIPLTGALAYDGTNVYAGLRTGVCALRPETGTPRWCVTGADVSRVAAGEEVVLVLEGARVVALSPTDGTEQWTRDTPDVGTPEVVAAGGALYLSGPRGIVAVDARSGATRWRVAGEYRFRPHVSEGTLYAIRNDGVNDRLDAFFTSDGSERYSTALRGRGIGAPTRAGSLVIVAMRRETSDRLEAFGTRSGRERWSRVLDHRAGPPVATGRLIAFEQDGHLELRDAERGEVWGGRQVALRRGERPVRASGVLVVRAGGRVEAVRI